MALIKRLIKLHIALIFWAFHKLISFFKRSKMPGTCVVLMYHDVSEENCQQFIMQMEELTQAATTIATDSFHELQKDKHYAAVTFDDGFASTIELVLPILTCRTIPATFFIPAALLGREAVWIKNMDRRKCVGPIIAVDDLQLLSKHKNIIIGSHGMNHLRLTEIKDRDARKELRESKKVLENIVGYNVKMHSFPFGAYEHYHVAMAREAGYELMFTVDPTIAIGTNEKFIIGRIEVAPTDWPLEFKLKVLGAYRWQPYASRLKKLFLTIQL